MDRVPSNPDFVAEALELFGLPACVCDSAGRIRYANTQFRVLMGGRGVSVSLPDVLSGVTPGQLREACHAETRWDAVLLAGDSQIAMQVSAKPLPANFGGPAATLVFNDVQGMKSDQSVLQETLMEQRAMLENVAVGIIFVRESSIREWNMRAANMFGYGLRELAGAPAHTLFADADSYSRLRDEALAALSAGNAFSVEKQLRRSDGTLFWCRLHGRAINPQQPTSGSIWIIEDIDAQFSSEAKLGRTVLEMQAIMDNAPVAIGFMRSGQILRYNQRFAEFFGYDGDGGVGRPTAELFETGAQLDELRAKAMPLLEQGQTYQAETTMRRQDGSLFWAHFYVYAIDTGAHQDTVWILEDVTDARQRLIETQAIMTNASVGILFTKNRVITRYNRGFAEMFGFDSDEALGLRGLALYKTEEAHAQVRARSAPLLQQSKPYHGEAEMMRKDGSMLWAHQIAYAVNPEDPTQGTIWILEDRTEKKRAEEELRNALMENQAILDTAVLGIAVVDGGRNLRCNRKMAELFGYSPDEIEGLPVRDLYPDDAGRQLARDETARDFRAGRASMGEYEMVRKDGSRFWARLSGRPFDFASPRGRSLWLVDDVTQRREAAEAIRRARDELEVRVLERTAELAGANSLLQGEIVERRQAEARVHHMAYHDSLTGLPNRALLADRLDRAILNAQRSDRKLAVMFLDLDRFKTINDSLGHLTGDHLLKEVANRLCNSVRASDTVARLGGDEFVVLVPGIRSSDESAQVAQKIIDALAAPVPFEGRTLHITPSIGICVYPDDGADVETLMRHADAAMYHAKENGRNNYQFFTQRMNQAASQYFELESSLRSAQLRSEFELYYQPIMDIDTRRVHALEVLLRWSRPGLGLAFPDQFIPILEENGQIVMVGEWVLRRACEESVRWTKAGREPVPLAVNLSPRQFMHRGLVESVRRILDETGIDPTLIEFEITETALMQHGEHTLDVLGQINAMGIRLSIDDFGTGYSSLAYLKRFPVHKVKIDRAFIRDLEDSSEDRAIVGAIIALADSLQLEVVAEGVETEGQFAQLREQGCDYAQGYLFSRPVPFEQLEPML